MDSAEVRSRWLRFFSERGHTVVPSASLIADDPTLLLVNAGMVPFKPFFLGEEPPPYQRATSVQKCVRTLDIDEVGKTTRHASFFQMCGNFSFGDYFKETAIPLAWELLTSPVGEGGYGLPVDRLWVTVYLDDDEAEAIWRDTVGVAPERIQRRGKADNFWSMGVPGPCGPSSEIFYDRGPEHGLEGGPVADEDRYVELWNLVFMQFERGAGDGKADYPIVGDLPAKNIDTGLGLERLAAVLQGVDNIYEIDTTRQILDRATELTGKHYGDDADADVRLRVVADHARTAVMLAGDGVRPGNEGRGYVLRRIMRRVVRTMLLLGAPQPTMAALVDSAILAMEPQYPELGADRARIESVCVGEETSFLQTLRAGTTLLESAVADVRGAGGSTLGGEQAFALHDTYGFPIDLTLEMAAEQGLAVDEDGFRRLMREQRDRAKADAKAKKTGHVDVSAYRAVLDDAGATTFTGYDEVVSEGTVRGLLRDGASAQAAAAGDDVELVLDRTPFYAEGGGQLADHGIITLHDGAVVEVHDVQAPVGGLVVHRATVLSGEVTVGAQAQSVVDLDRRLAISRAHTATHLVHKAFRDALGETATQAGSENAPGRFRFDFAATGAVPAGVLVDVEQTVNEVLSADLAVTAEVMSQDEARAIGAMALFGEKYGDRVRVVSVGDWARELCGGTHVRRSAQLGLVKLLGESSIGAGVRRVEALVGVDAYRFLAREHVLLAQVTDVVKGRPEEMPERVAAIVARLRDAEREIERMRADSLRAEASAMTQDVHDIDGVGVLALQGPAGLDAGGLRQLVLDVRGGLPADRPAVVVGAAEADGKAALVATTNDAARDAGLSANAVLRAVLPHVDGRGGGKDDVAQGGGTKPAGIAAALAAVDDAVRAARGA